MNSHQNQQSRSDDLGRDEARSFAPHWLVDSLDLLGTTVPTPSDWEISSQKSFVRRVKSEVRNQESSRIHNSLPGGLAKHLKGELPGSVPGGTAKYFTNFLPSVRERIEEAQAPSKVSPLLSKALDRFGKTSKADLPEDYFSDFLVQVHERIDSEENVPEWLDRSLKSPQAFGSLNESFFDRQRESIDGRVYRPVAIMRLVKNNRLKVRAVAATAACIALMFAIMPSFNTAPVEAMTINKKYESRGYESLDDYVRAQDSIIGGSPYSLELIRQGMKENEQTQKLDAELIEGPSVLSTPKDDVIVVQ